MSAQLCGAYADHVDHVRPWSWWTGLRPRRGSTSAWRRLRAYVLDRDGRRCQLPVDAAGDYDQGADQLLVAGLADDGQPTGLPLPSHPDDPANLRAACARHNLQRGDARAAAPRRHTAGADWSW